MAAIEYSLFGKLEKKDMLMSLPALCYVYLHMKNGTVREIPFDCSAEDPFDALKRVYRSKNGDDFMVYEVEKITFSD